MSHPGPTPLEHLSRRSWLLWALTILVVLALTAAVPLLYLPLMELEGTNGMPSGQERDAYYAIVGLAGLVVTFCLYTWSKQRELEAMRSALHREEREKDDVRNRLSELSALFQVSTSLNLQLRLDVILEIIVRRVVSTLRAQQASVMIYNPETGVLETRSSYGLEAEFARNGRQRLGEGIAGWVAERSEGLLLSESAASDPMRQHYKPDRHISSALSLPLRVGERCVGVLNVNRINHPETFKEHHRELLLMFADHVGAVIDRAETMDRLGSRTRQLEADNRRLSETNRLKDVFLSTASHELKTPLTSVIAYAELLDDNAGRLDGTQRSEFLRRLRAEAGRLLSLIEDILDVSRIESGKMTIRRSALRVEDIARSAVETTRSMAAKHGVTIEESYEEHLPAIPLDEVKMRQVVVNLLVNAVKFSPANGRVSVRTVREADHVLLEVKDQGPGIPPEDAAHIFELFGQGVNEQRDSKGGLGIGLHLVKRIVEIHGGHVGVNSPPGSGSAFWLRLPLALAEITLATEDAEQAA